MTTAAANSTTTGTLPANTLLRVLGASIVTITRNGAVVATQSTERDNFVGPYPTETSYSVVAGGASIDIRVKDREGVSDALVPAMLTTDASGNTVLVGADGNSVLRGPMTSDVWFTCPSVFRLRLTGTGTVTLASRDSAGTVTTVDTYTLSGATDQIEFPYAGDNAVAIRATLTGTTTVEVI